MCSGEGRGSEAGFRERRRDFICCRVGEMEHLGVLTGRTHESRRS